MNSLPHETPRPNVPAWLYPLTPEEESLLDLYRTVKAYEREAQIRALDAAKAKLAPKENQTAAGDDSWSNTLKTGESKKYVQESEKEFEQRSFEDRLPGDEIDSVESDSPTDRKRKRTTRKSETYKSGDEKYTADSDVDQTSDQEMSKSELEEIRRRREAKLAQLRSERDSAMQKKEVEEAAAQAEEKLRISLLQNSGAEGIKVSALGPSLKKKRLNAEDASTANEFSLIANMEGATTPPHEFSKILGLNRNGLSGSLIFPDSDTAAAWSPSPSASHPQDGCLELHLPKFDASQVAQGVGFNTIAVKFFAPIESKRFSVNITTPDHDNYNRVLFHFNPRPHHKGGQLVLNHKMDGIWGQSMNIPLSTMPFMFGQACTLFIQINGDGFDIIVEGRHCARLEHRTPLPAHSGLLILQFPATDDYGVPENWTVYKVWWGHKPSMASSDLSSVPGADSFSMAHPKKLFITGLSKIYTDAEVDLRRAELERAFRKYGGSQGAMVTVSNNSTYAFVELDDERMADLALSEMSGQYRLSRARRSRHEALTDERATADAANHETKAGKGTSDWD